MKFSRRKLFAGSLAAGVVAALPTAETLAAESDRRSRMKLGTVTYNIAKYGNVPTIIKNRSETGFEGVELRTTHAHGVEVTLSKEQRAEVRKRFADSKIQLMGLGSVFEFQMPDQAKLRKQIEGCKEYIILAQDVGATGVKVRPNGVPKDVPIEKTLEQIGRSLEELAPFAADHGQQIRLEVHGAVTSLLPNIRTILDVADHKNVGACWNSNQSDLEGQGFDYNFNLVRDKIFSVHMRDLYLEEYPFARLLHRLNEIGFGGFCLAEIPESSDPLRVLRYFRGLWLALQQ